MRLLWLSAAVLAIVPSIAHADAEPADNAKIVARLCSNITVPTPPISQTRLAEAIVIESGLLPSDLVGIDKGGLVTTLQAIETGKLTVAEGKPLAEPISRLRFNVSQFSSALRTGAIDGLLVEGSLPSDTVSLFAADTTGWTLTCKTPEEAVSIIESYGPKEKQFLSIREKPEELAIGGDKRKEAGAFALGLERTWKDKDDGSEVRETTLKIDGTVGIRLTDKQADETAYGFLQYNLKRARTRPAKVLAAGERREANDTDVLAIGAMADLFYERDSHAIWVVSQGAYVRDFADNSSRIRMSTAVDPGLSFDARVCNFGSAQPLRDGPIGARCLLRVDSELGLWTDDGLTVTKSYDDFVALGGNFSYELFYSTGKKSEALASFNLRYLPVIAGRLDDIFRMELALKQRIWTDLGPGVDIGFSYIDGTNALSLDDERILRFGIGIIY